MRNTKFIERLIVEYEVEFQKTLFAFHQFAHQEISGEQLILLQNEALESARLKYLDLATEYRQHLIETENIHSMDLEELIQYAKEQGFSE